ncbi:MAG: SDR family oxidoreductase [Lachnospiraceae bacterium]|nr:SDR family oxidoreductase [Lachnospiraceae bacterium]
MDSGLKDKVVLITGSTGGIGKSLAKAFAGEGAKIALTSRSQEKLDALIAELDVAKDYVAGFIVDVSNEDQVKAAVEGTIERFGALDVLVNNSGDNGNYKPIAELTREDFLKVYDINVFGVMYGMKYAIPQMRKQGKGAIVNITSEGEFVGAAGMAPYCSSKHAAGGLSKCVALEVAKENIRVNTICPGAVDTPMMRRIEEQWLGKDYTRQQALDVFAAQYPDGKYADPDEVATATVFLASDLSGHVTGASLRIDGGKSATA